MVSLAVAATMFAASPSTGEEAGAYVVTGDAILQPLGGATGDPARGTALLTDRHRSLCTLCHSGPFPDPHLQGSIAPDLTGIGARLSEGQIRLRVVDMKRIMPNTIMPSYYWTAGEEDRRIAAGWRGKPILSSDDIEDIVAYLATLKE